VNWIPVHDTTLAWALPRSALQDFPFRVAEADVLNRKLSLIRRKRQYTLIVIKNVQTKIAARRTVSRLIVMPKDYCIPAPA
jgi:hypothetical protein